MTPSSRGILAGLLALEMVAAGFSQPRTVDPGSWREDLRYLAAEMPRWHRNLFHTVTRPQFEDAVGRLDRRIDSLPRHQIIVEMARIVAAIGDGHTNIAPTRDPHVGFHTYPIKLYFFSDGLYIRAATRHYAGLVGARILSVGKASVDEAYGAVCQIIGRDNDMGARYFAPFLLTMPEVLHALGLIDDLENGAYTIELQGRRTVITLAPSAPVELQAPDTDTSWLPSDGWVDARQTARAPTPLWLKDPRNAYWFEYLPGPRTVYVQFNHVANKDEETLDAFTKRLFAFVEQHAVDRFILDLRLNRGGNGQLNRCLLLGIIRSSIDRKGRLFTIIGRGTWSAAQFLVGDLEKYTNTVFVGEPTGGKPNSYGDSHKIVLPKSGIAVRVSTLWWQGDERDKRQWVAPQIATALSFQEYRSNADPALNAVLNYVPRKPLSELLTIALSDGGWTRASAAYAAWKADPANAHAEVEEELNTLGYQLLRSRRTEEAIGIFTLNVDGHPESANAYDSLGEAYTIAGQREPAIKACQRSLELDPKNEHAQAMLRQLQER